VRGEKLGVREGKPVAVLVSVLVHRGVDVLVRLFDVVPVCVADLLEVEPTLLVRVTNGEAELEELWVEDAQKIPDEDGVRAFVSLQDAVEEGDALARHKSLRCNSKKRNIQ